MTHVFVTHRVKGGERACARKAYLLSLPSAFKETMQLYAKGCDKRDVLLNELVL